MTVEPESLLLVDDNATNLDVLSRLLHQHGYRVRPVTSGRQALEIARTLPPDLVLLDMRMPDMDGIDVCRQLKVEPATSDIPVIFISAADAVEDKVRAFDAGGVDYVTKPFEAREVLSRVATQLRLHSLQRDLRVKVAELERANARIRELSIRDELTQLYNRRHFNDRAAQMLAHARRYGSPLTFAIGDIDHFKSINDRFSHASGDDVLRRVARLMLDNTRTSDVVARYGGEEFAMAFPATPLAEAVQVCEKLRMLVARQDWSDVDAALEVTASIGLAALTDETSFEQVMAVADTRLYEAKRAGRNQVRA